MNPHTNARAHIHTPVVQYDTPRHRGRAGGTEFRQDNMEGSRAPRGNPGVADVQATPRQTQTRQLKERGGAPGAFVPETGGVKRWKRKVNSSTVPLEPDGPERPIESQVTGSRSPPIKNRGLDGSPVSLGPDGPKRPIESQVTGSRSPPVG